MNNEKLMDLADKIYERIIERYVEAEGEGDEFHQSLCRFFYEYKIDDEIYDILYHELYAVKYVMSMKELLIDGFIMRMKHQLENTNMIDEEFINLADNIDKFIMKYPEIKERVNDVFTSSINEFNTNTMNRLLREETRKILKEINNENKNKN
ncbi:hypothetical protein [Acinetobacter brisouii]|uniref:hypothetical protein n=1 Tax=Acinetobacter brisouii TaxID=396323 RepID=UPI0035AF10A1